METPKRVLVADIIAYHDLLDLQANPKPIAIPEDRARSQAIPQWEAQMRLEEAKAYLRMEEQVYQQKMIAMRGRSL